jgi:hypothetical protein
MRFEPCRGSIASGRNKPCVSAITPIFMFSNNSKQESYSQTTNYGLTNRYTVLLPIELLAVKSGVERKTFIAQKQLQKTRRVPAVRCIITAHFRDAWLGRGSWLGCPVSNRIRTSRFRFATADRPEQARESHPAVAHVAIDTPSDRPCPVHSQRRLPEQLLWHRRLRLTHGPQHAPLPPPVRRHRPPLWQLRATLWRRPWHDRQQFELASL